MDFKKLLLAGTMLAGAGIASADITIPVWDFQTTTGFDNDGAWSCSNGSGPGDNTCALGFSNVNASGDYETLSWGTESNVADAQSYLNITNMIGSIITNGGWFDINFFDHFNHIITRAGGNMSGVNINGLFEITAPLYLPVPGVNFVSFFETPNVDSDDCSGPNPNDSACDDIFTTAGLNGSAPIFVDDDGGTYVLSFQFFGDVGTTVVDNGDGTFTIYTTEACSSDGEAGCSAAELAAGYTPGFSRLITQARIDYIVPTPETLALFGLGLLGFAMRRPRAK